MKLKEVGFILAASKSWQLRSIHFKSGMVYITLFIPRITVDGLLRSRILNLVAFEMRLDARSDYGVISYVWLMNMLIDVPEDVKELRSKKILVNMLGSNKQVAELFNELAKDLLSDFNAYRWKWVGDGIRLHCDKKFRVVNFRMLQSTVSKLHTYFDNPLMGPFAAVFLLTFTAVQTYFVVWPRGKI